MIPIVAVEAINFWGGGIPPYETLMITFSMHTVFYQVDDAVTIFFDTHFCAATNFWKAHKPQRW